MSRPFSTKQQKGFTLIELLTSIAIMGVVLSVVLLNQSQYTEAARVTTLADEMALRLSEAQSYGVAVKERSPGTSDFSSAYGVAVSILGSGSTTSYILFLDRNANQIYDGAWDCPVGGTSECLERVDLTSGYTIDSLCNIKTSGPVICNNVKRVDMTFLRPNPKAQMIFFNSGGQQYSPSNLTGEKIGLKSPSGVLRYISVYLSGQVGVSTQ